MSKQLQLKHLVCLGVVEPPNFLVDAAKYYKAEPHQIASWQWLNSQLTEYTLKEFKARYRSTEVAPVAFKPSTPFDYLITPHISYGEVTLQSESRRFIDQHQCNTCLEICEFLEKARTKFHGSPIIITSGHRPSIINSKVGGSVMSEHLYNEKDKGAIDFYLDGIGLYGLQKWCDDNWPYSLGYGAPKGFVHIGMRPGKPYLRWNY